MSSEDNNSTTLHPSKEITGSKGHELDGKKIVLCITGSVAAYRAIDLARLLMRHGADVYAVMSDAAATGLLHPELMKWATGNKVVSKLTGDLEHIALADYGMSDLVIVYPCTANTIGKVVAGIDDTPVTSVLSVAIGSKIPVIIAPAMHEAMYENPFIQANVKKLQIEGITFVSPQISEGKAKVAEPEQILAAVIDTASTPEEKKAEVQGLLVGKNILITAGSTIEYIDPIRVVTNLSSGKMGIAIAREAERRGANVTLVYGHGTEEAPEGRIGDIIRVDTARQMAEVVSKELRKKKFQVVIMTAAVADFAPATASPSKIDTRKGGLEISLEPTRKIVNEIKKVSGDSLLIAFKADYNVSDSMLVEKAYAKLKECSADLVVANDIGRIGQNAGSDRSEVFIIDPDRKIVHIPLDTKTKVATNLLDLISNLVIESSLKSN